MSGLAGRRMLLGVTGSIAAFKAVELAREAERRGATVDVVLTEAAQRFVTALTFASLVQGDVVASLWEPAGDRGITHVSLGQRADLAIVAPATADALARLAHGLADDALTTTLLAAAHAPLLVAPAMEPDMYAHPATQANLAMLRDRGVTVIEPESGIMASGRSGQGRLPDIGTILEHAAIVLGRSGPLAGRTVLVTSGGTQEAIDPVRRITNRSSGRMGHALAIAARDAGARVILVTGPTSLPDPVGVEVVRVTSALEMHDAVLARAGSCDAILKAAAVADFRPEETASQKIKRAGRDELLLRLIPNPDIAAAVGARRRETGMPRVLLVFAAESQDLEANARAKLTSKNADLLVMNDITAQDAGFESEDNRVSVFGADGSREDWALQPKSVVAARLVARVAALLGDGTRPGGHS